MAVSIIPPTKYLSGVDFDAINQEHGMWVVLT